MCEELPGCLGSCLACLGRALGTFSPLKAFLGKKADPKKGKAGKIRGGSYPFLKALGVPTFFKDISRISYPFLKALFKGKL